MRIHNQISGFTEGDPIEGCPCLALFDICNAFPTIAHTWLFAVLAGINLSPKVFRLIKLLYHNSRAYPVGVGTGELLFIVLSGVRTGCPLSATLFLLALNPFVHMLNYLIVDPVVPSSCLCADDVGSALRALKSLSVHRSVFNLCARVAGMHLKPSKCFIVITVVNISPELIFAVKNWLQRNIPEWSDFQVVDCARYLGFFLGRDGRENTYKDPCEKYLSRVDELALAQAPALGTLIRYNERVATVFSYVAQVMPPPDPKRFCALEQRGVH